MYNTHSCFFIMNYIIYHVHINIIMIVFTFELTFYISVQSIKKNEKSELDRNTATAEHFRDTVH